MAPALKRFMLNTPHGCILATILALITSWLTGIPENIDRSFFDQRSRAWASAHPAPTNAALVLVDEFSLKAAAESQLAGRWPWRRELFAAMIASLHHAGASKVVLDFIFKEASEDALQDDLMAAWAAVCPGTILSTHAGQGPVFWDETFRRLYPEFRVGERLGHVDYAADPDGVIRSYFMGDSLAAKAAGGAWPSEARLLRWHGGLEQLKQSGVPVLPAFPFVVSGIKIVDAATARLKNYDPRSLAGALPSIQKELRLPQETARFLEQVRGKVVFVGANSAGTFDLKATPVGQKEPGVLAHFTAWTNASQGVTLVSSPTWWNLLSAAGIPSLLILAAQRWRGLRRHLALAGFALAALTGLSMAAFSNGVYFAPASTGLGIGFALLCVIARGFWEEEERRREIQQWFGSYVSREVVEKLVRDPQALRLGGEKKELTVYFSDLAGFTDMSEGMEPEALIEVINGYLTELSPCILDHGGYLDKYIGDAIMGVFGSPTPLEHHAVSACRAALDSRDRLARLNVKLQAERGFSLHARIGVNSGMMIVGNMGSELKKNYTVMGDAVNLASRLEGANKEFGTTILLGERTEELVRGRFLTRPVSRLRVKGKQQPIQTHELLGTIDTASGHPFVEPYTEGYAAFMNRDFAGARAHFQKALALKPDDALAAVYLDKSVEFLKKPPEPGWDGVLQLTRK